jgi:hypothetical protein
MIQKRKNPAKRGVLSDVESLSALNRRGLGNSVALAGTETRPEKYIIALSLYISTFSGFPSL